MIAPIQFLIYKKNGTLLDKPPFLVLERCVEYYYFQTVWTSCYTLKQPYAVAFRTSHKLLRGCMGLSPLWLWLWLLVSGLLSLLLFAMVVMIDCDLLFRRKLCFVDVFVILLIDYWHHRSMLVKCVYSYPWYADVVIDGLDALKLALKLCCLLKVVSSEIKLFGLLMTYEEIIITVISEVTLW
jgi:hypothetical protein